MSNQEYEVKAAELTKILRELLQDVLGVFDNGKTAIWVEPPQSPKNGNGVHVFIQRQLRQISNTTYQWQVALVLHGIRENDAALYEINLQKFDKAISLMRSKFPVRREVAPPFQEEFPPQHIFYLGVTQSYLTRSLIFS